MPALNPALVRAENFARAHGLQIPILLAPMAGACPPSLSIAVANAGGLGSCGALLMKPEAIRAWASEVRAGTNGGFQLNLSIPDPPPTRDAAAEAECAPSWRRGDRKYVEAGDVRPLDFSAQCEAMLEVAPSIISSIMGLYTPEFVERMKAKRIKWFANVTTVKEAMAAEAAGADAIVVQGMEAGGHRGAFDAGGAEAAMVGLFALLPAVVDAVKVPVIAAGGIAVGGASLRRSCWAPPPFRSAPASCAAPKRSCRKRGPTRWRASRRRIRSSPEHFPVARGAASPPRTPAPRPALTRRGRRPTRATRIDAGDARGGGPIGRYRDDATWAGQSAGRALAKPAAEIARQLWEGARTLLTGGPNYYRKVSFRHGRGSCGQLGVARVLHA